MTPEDRIAAAEAGLVRIAGPAALEQAWLILGAVEDPAIQVAVAASRSIADPATRAAVFIEAMALTEQNGSDGRGRR